MAFELDGVSTGVVEPKMLVVVRISIAFVSVAVTVLLPVTICQACTRIVDQRSLVRFHEENDNVWNQL